MNEELISIIIPVYNSEKYIERCIESVINQTYKNIEVVVVNDGSRDKSESIIREYLKKDKRIKLINQKNSGVSSARNNGIINAKGKYLTFIDSDDYYELDAIERLYDIMKNSEYDLVRGNYRIVKNDTAIETGNVNPENIEDYYELYNKIFDNTIPSYTVLLLIKRDFIIDNNIDFDEEIAMMEDTIFYIKIFSKHPKAYFDSYITYNYEYNENSASKSSKFYKRNLYNVLDVNIKIKEILKKDENYNEKKLNTLHYNTISNYLYELYFIEKAFEWKKIYNDITSNEKFLNIENKFNYMRKMHFLITEILLKYRKESLLIFFYKIRKNFSKKIGED